MLPSVQRSVAETRHRHPDISAHDHEWRFLHLVASHGGKIKRKPAQSDCAPETKTLAMIVGGDK
jgi:hypothetical protein